MKEFHYYGNIERRLFLIGGVVMLGTFPFFDHLIPVSAIASVAGVAILAFFAGLINPMQRWLTIVNVVIAGGALLIFGYYAVLSYPESFTSHNAGLFGVNLLLSFIFFFALYYGTKTARGVFSQDYEHALNEALWQDEKEERISTEKEKKIDERE